MNPILKNFLKFLGVAVLGVIAAYVIVSIISEREIREKAKEEARRQKATEAFKAKILSKDTRRVKVGLRDRNGNAVGQEFEIKSDKGVDPSLREGQEIVL